MTRGRTKEYEDKFQEMRDAANAEKLHLMQEKTVPDLDRTRAINCSFSLRPTADFRRMTGCF